MFTNTQGKIRNFCIISHVDHGKSTLADRLLELTGTVEQRKMREQFLDMMELEREKGITIKLQPVRMEYDGYVLNLIDTPGHVDFSYEVSRSLAAVEGAILLVDASQGIQAQTLANLRLAQEQGLVIIPVVNKIDLAQARISETVQELSRLLEVPEGEVVKISAKEGRRIDQVLRAVIERIPAPDCQTAKPLRALIFDSSYDRYQGVIAYVRIVDGQVRRGSKIRLMAAGVQMEAVELGVFKPNRIQAASLRAGEIGYITTGLRDLDKCRVGDTITAAAAQAQPLAGYEKVKPFVFAGLYPADAGHYNTLKGALDKLKLSDASLSYEAESCEGLGRGFKCGFLGMLHMEITLERLRREYQLDLTATSPSVRYHIVTESQTDLIVSSPHDWPEINSIQVIKEPWVRLKLLAPEQYLGTIMKLLENMRGEHQTTNYLTSQKVLVEYAAPLSEVIENFYNQLKNATAGYASMSYEAAGERAADLVKLDILIAGEQERAFSRIVHRSRASQEGRALVRKLKQVVPPQLFAVSLQAAVGGKVIARETIRPYRKDVTGYLYGGDYSRKKKLLEKQKRGKKKMKTTGRVHLPPDVFLRVLRK